MVPGRALVAEAEAASLLVLPAVRVFPEPAAATVGHAAVGHRKLRRVVGEDLHALDRADRFAAVERGDDRDRREFPGLGHG